MASPEDKQTPEDQKRDEVLRRMLNTPPKPHKPKGGGKSKKEQARGK